MKYLSVALALAAFAATGTVPAFARTAHDPAPQYTQQRLYMYAPGYRDFGYTATPYPNPVQRTGSLQNREELGY